MMRLVVLGHPIAHSRSPVMHNAALAELGIAGGYRAVDVPSAEGMAIFAEAVRSGDLVGANITMPHKSLAYELADRVSDEAAVAGSVNTWYRREGDLVGATTDVGGVRHAWERRGLPSSGPVLVLGSGGAARAAVVALSGRPLTVSARDGAKAARLAAIPGVDARVVPWGSPVVGATIVNCTPLGMHGEDLPVQVWDETTGLFDMAYGERDTPAVCFGRARGLPVVDGIDLLVAQAAVSFELWTGLAPPVTVMEQAARNVSSG